MATRRAPAGRSTGDVRDPASRDDGNGRMAGDSAALTGTSGLSWREWLDRPAVLGLNNGQALLLFGLLFALLFTRFWDLGTRAMHHDESMHAKYAWDTYRGNFYKYNPLLHGPFQFLAVAASFWLFGATEATARAVPAAFGVALVLLVFAWRRQLGTLGLLFTVALLTFSPSFTYFSRFLREDAYVVTWTMLFAVGLVSYIATHRRAWLYAAAAGAAFAFATKESTYITLFIFGTFILSGLALEWWRRRRARRRARRAPASPITSGWQAVFRDRTAFWGAGAFAGSIIIVLVILLFLFTSLGTNPAGLRDGFTASLTYWLDQHGVQRGNQPFFYYLLTLSGYEIVALVFGLIGLVAAVLRPTVFTSFLAWWFVLALVIYSWAGEKMPWLTMHIALPLMILAGWFLGRLFSQPRPWRLGPKVAVGALGVLGLYTIHTSWPMNFERGDVPKDILIYTQTSPDVPRIMRDIEDLSLKTTGDSSAMGVVSTAGTWWPFSWYLRDFKNAEFPAKLTAAPTKPVVLVALDEDQQNRPFLVGYSPIRYRMRWWFPEDYRSLTFSTIWGAFTNSEVRDPFLRWLWQRETVSELGSYDFYVYIKDGYGLISPLVGEVASPQTVEQRAAAAERARRYTEAAVPLEQVGAIGSRGRAGGQLSDPRGIAVDDEGNVYVADGMNHRIQKFDPSGRLLLAWGTQGQGDGQFTEPLDVLVEPGTGHVLVADTWNHRIQKFDANGQFLSQWGSEGQQISQKPGEFYGPRAIAQADGALYAADTGNKRIQKFDTNGTLLGQIGVGGQLDGQLNEPIGLTVTPAGDIYVADTHNGRIQRFDKEGNFVLHWSVLGWSNQVRNEPYLANDPEGNIYVADSASQRVLKFDPDGKLLAVGTAPVAGGQGLNLPSGIAVWGSRLYVADTLNGRVRIFNLLPSVE
ncbi:MAG: hypothetical protein CL878_00450 [Dehalococcoidia bacterium]|nr:hypothetical protein [Dehalococcoidia bacterium]